MTEPKPNTGGIRVVAKKARGLLPHVEQRRNDWSPLPAGVVVAAFVGPVGLIFLIGAVLDTDNGLSPFYGLLAVLCALITIWAMSDAAYIAGMRRIADQDLKIKLDPPPKRIYREDYYIAKGKKGNPSDL